ncbi:hypothetical protein BU23DRAFT_554092 [Bimuria novae-zelandiae CBS 107.79]|uniref:Asparagine synthetase domain-containing protein n=1 Tax=Bimuria novae-zelandiae CBS 107.79 TaxID=1447943 RepID=A0A6A5V7S4_9PLEO|nr:hypothetical protein BU23DRAFT_554092 [Bimuria novae-zelandiae CBS 107.79]
MKSFLAFGWKPEWDVQALVDHGWRTDGRTMFKGVRKVLPGHYLISKHYGPVEEKPYWDIEYPNKNVRETRTEAEMIQGVQDRMLESVRLRLRADVPVGIYLSGGLDSSAIAGMIAHVLKEGHANLGNDASKDLSKMTCLCVQFDKDSGADESEIAKRTANWLGVKFVPVLMDDEALAKNFEDAAWFSETVMPDANGPGRLAMAAIAHKQGLKVVLTGEGSDEHFGGYSSYAPEAIREVDPSWPSSDFPESDRLEALRLAEARPDLNFGGEVGVRPESTSRMLNGSIQTKRLATLTPVKWASWTDCYSDRNQETLMVESFDGRVREAIATKWHPLHTAQYIHTKTAFPNLLLRYVGDNVDMVNQIESRTPFLDHHVTEYANGLPPSLKMKYDPVTKTFNEKYVLKEAMRPFVPDEIYNRKKHSFVGPTRYPDGPFKDLLEKLITKENIEQLGFLDWKQMSELVSKAFEGKDPLAMRGAMVAAQFVVLGKRFDVAKATPEILAQL